MECKEQIRDGEDAVASAGALSDDAKATLGEKLDKRGAVDGEFEDGAAMEVDEEEVSCGHGHAQKPESILTAIASAVINFLLMFGLCCAYGIIMFEDEWNARHRGLGVKINLATALIVGLALACFSKVPVAIGGPDLNPVVFLGMLAQTIAKEVAKSHGLDELYPAGGRLCPGAPKPTFCKGGVFTKYDSIVPDDLGDFEDATSYAFACDQYHQELRATVLFTVSVTSAILGLLLVLLGRLKLTRFLSFIPTNIMEAFLACIGYKVFKYALKFCKYEPKQFLPAACVGVPLYFIKALHLGNPAIVIPLMLMIPLGIYYAIVFGLMQEDLEKMRKEKWMFDTLENAEFWTLWEHGIYMSWDKINFSAFAASLKDLPIMIIVCTLDCALKVFSTDAKLPVKTDKDFEVQLYGTANVLTTLCSSSVGYMQLKFNVINYGVMGNAIDRRGGLLYALMCGVCFFWTTDPFNYLPRFFLSTLLFFAGSGFVAENLWGSRKFLSVSEWIQVLLIIALFILSGSLLLAVVLGGLIAACSFVLNISRVPAVIGNVTGSKVTSHIRQTPADQMNIQYVSGQWLLVTRLKGFIFFGSARALGDAIMSRLRAQEDNPTEYQHFRYIIMDLTMVDGLDASAAKILLRLVNSANEHHIRMLWCTTNEATITRLNASGTISSRKDLFKDLGTAMAFVEKGIVSHISSFQKLWLKLHPGLMLHRGLVMQQSAFEPFQDILTSDASRFGCPWKFCSRLELKKHETILFKPRESSDLFLVHSGQVGLFTSVPQAEGDEWGQLVATYRRGSFLNIGAMGMQRPTQYYAVALEDGEVVVWNQAQWHLMSDEQPTMEAALGKAVLSQESEEMRIMSLDLNASADNAQRPVDSPRKEYEDVQWLPGSLQRLKAGLSTAQWLGELGLYCAEPGLEATLPALPPPILQDLKIAFNTYCNPERLISVADAEDALKYAGVYGSMLRENQKGEAALITEDAFLRLGHTSAMAPIGEEQEKKLKQLFFETVGSDDPLACMRREHLTRLFKEIGQGFSLDVVAGVAKLWCSDSRSQVDADAFVGIMSRTAKVHEKYWFVVLAFREILQTHSGMNQQANNIITPELLVAASEKWPVSIDQDKAEEMIWLANFVNPECKGSVDVLALAAVISTVTMTKPQRLPPKPKLNNVMESEDETAVRETGGVGPGEKISIRQSVADTRTSLFVDTKSMVSMASTEEMLGEADDIARRFSSDGRVSEFGRGDSILITDVADGSPRGCPQRTHIFLEMPESSRAARWFSMVMTLFILSSVLTLVLEPTMSGGPDITEKEKEVWFSVDGFFSVTFTVELLLRFAFCNALGKQTHIQFLKSPLNLADIAAVLPWYIDLATMGDSEASEFRLLRIARLMRLARLVRLGRLASKCAVVAPVACILVVIWGIFLKNGLTSSC